MQIYNVDKFSNINPNLNLQVYGNSWWNDINCPLSFKYFDIDQIYDFQYFDSPSHPSPEISRNLYNYMQMCYKNIFGRNFESVLEIGTGGGEITSQFIEHDLDYIAIEGTTFGFNKLCNKFGNLETLIKHDLRKPLNLNRKFDIVICTEVIEHIEPFFASTVIYNCITHSNVVWFSCADRNRPPHIHHSNEQDISVWDNIFAFLDYNYIIHLDKRFERADRIYMSNNINFKKE